MQEAFEKIVEKFEERTGFLSDCTKYGNKDAKQQEKSYSTMFMYEVADLIDDLIEIVKNEAAEYSNGFNDITENGLPPVGKPLIVTIKDNLQGKPNELRYPVYYEKDSMKCGYHWSWRYGDFTYELLPDVSEVIAWQPLPEPYQPKGE